MSTDSSFGAPQSAAAGTDTAWLKSNILSLDGGGIRGYWSLLVLELLMENIAHAEERADMAEGEENHHSFSPQPWPDNVSQIPLTDKETMGRREAQSTNAKICILPRSRRYLPCHYFDYICGSNTGALIAIMLGRFRMTVSDCNVEYQTLGQEVFGKPRVFCTVRFGVGERHKYEAARLERVFKDVTRRRNHQPEQVHGRIAFPSGRGLCQTFVTSLVTEGIGTNSYLIRSYDHNKRVPPENSTRPPPGSLSHPSRDDTDFSALGTRGPTNIAGRVEVNHEKAQDFEIWQVARAATAAPLYFEPLEIESALTQRTMVFTDGGFGGTNNPVEKAKQEIEELHGDAMIDIIVSIGTARKAREKRKKAFWSTVRELIKDFAHTATDPEVHHDIMQREHQRFQNDEFRSFSYYRLNDPGGLEIELDEWKPKQTAFSEKRGGFKTIEVMENKFNSWAAKLENIRDLQDCAAELVDRRRKRMNTPRWERYATGARYECRGIGCFLECGHLDGDQFKDHLRRDHHIMEERLDDVEIRRRDYWRYQPPSAPIKK